MNTPYSVKPYAPNTSERKALEALNRYYCMTTKQFLRRYYSENSYEYAQEAHRILTRKGYLVRRELYSDTRSDVEKHVYYLARAGKEYLKRQGIAILIKHTPSFLPPIDYKAMEHALGITDVLITADVAAEQYPEDLQIMELRHEKVLEKQLKNRKPVVDGWELFHVHGTTATGETVWYPFPIAWEIDNATERNEAIFKSGKIEQVIHWYETAYPKQFGTTKLTVAFVSLAGQKRRDIMRDWTQEELTRLHKRYLANLFRFTDLHPATTDPYTFSFEDVWQIPFWQRPISLFTEVS